MIFLDLNLYLKGRQLDFRTPPQPLSWIRKVWKKHWEIARADERVPPELISSSIEIRTLRRVTFFVCFCKTERALDKESPALIMPLKFFVRMISSAVLTRSRRCSKKATTLNGLVFFAEIDTGIFPRDRSSRPREKRSRESISPSTIDPSFDFAL